MNFTEAGAYLGRTRRWVSVRAHDGRLPAIKDGKRLYISRAALDAWLGGGNLRLVVSDGERVPLRQRDAAASSSRSAA